MRFSGRCDYCKATCNFFSSGSTNEGSASVVQCNSDWSNSLSCQTNQETLIDNSNKHYSTICPFCGNKIYLTY